MSYDTPAALRTALEARLANEAREHGLPLDRLRRRAVFERLLVRLDAHRPGLWVLKGGVALEVRWRGRARTTKDLDLAMRVHAVEGGALHDLVLDALDGDPDGDGFRFAVPPPRALAADQLGRAGWRFSVRALLAGRELATVRVDVVCREDELVATERLTLPGALAFAGAPRRTVEAVAREQHVAEKLHALTRDYGDRENSRVRDLVDLVLLLDDGPPDPSVVARVVRDVFAARATHPPPTMIDEPPAAWDAGYRALADELTISAATLPDALTRLRAYWRRVVDTGDVGTGTGGIVDVGDRASRGP